MAGLGSGRRTARRGVKRRMLSLLLVTGAVLWCAGFLNFVSELPRHPEAPDRKTDAIVVLTGGTLRLEEGLRLLAEDRAKKLFVSGVHQGVEVRELLRLSAAQPEEVACCIALGYAADNTVGNARETAEWMDSEGFRSLRLVTAGYHMPRSLVEFRSAMPEVEILAHPVMPDQVKIDSWWRYPGTTLLLAEEFTKTELARLANWLIRFIVR